MTTARSPSVKSPEFVLKQAAELDWWYQYLQHPMARQRMYALYGARYYGFFWKEFGAMGDAIEFGSGPLPVLDVTHCTTGLAVDTLADGYQGIGLYASDVPLVANSDELEAESQDTALLLNVLDHAGDPEGLVREAARVLRRGGQALVFVHVARADDKHYAIGVGSVRSWLEAAGLEVVRQALRQTMAFDPPAFLAVTRRL